jgi:hypothetical protein
MVSRFALEWVNLYRYSTVDKGKVDASKDAAEPTPAEAARRKLDNFSLFAETTH